MPRSVLEGKMAVLIRDDPTELAGRGMVVSREIQRRTRNDMAVEMKLGQLGTRLAEDGGDGIAKGNVAIAKRGRKYHPKSLLNPE